MMETSEYLKKVLPSTGLRSHFSISIDKSTPNRHTNHAILIIIPVDGKRMAIPIDAPIVYNTNDDCDIEGGSGEDLANQVIEVLEKVLELTEEDLCYIWGIK